MVQEEIDRPSFAGITDPADVRLRLEDSQLPNEVDVLLDMDTKLSLISTTGRGDGRVIKSGYEKAGRCGHARQKPKVRLQRSKTLRKPWTSLTLPPAHIRRAGRRKVL